MTEPQPKKTKKLIAIAVLCALVLGTVVSWQILHSTPQASVPEETQPPQDGLTFQRSASWSEYRPATHLTPNSDWMNDPQRPFFLDGVWHFYYLYNADYPEGNGTEWYHATSTDFIHWKDEGVAIEKYKNGLGDIWTGSAVVDTENTAGFGKNAVVSLVTQQVDGVQRQSLFYSTDGGYSFTSYEGNPVMDNPGVEAWRDPKIVWDKERNQWLMLLAEGSKVGFYTSRDLKSWNYQSGFETTGLGIVECPDLFQMSVDGDPERTTWVLGVSANGAESGRTTGYTYWTGSFDGKNFSADQNDPRWLDAGSDFYAAVTWDDPQAQDQLAHRYAMGWMNNWAYAGELPLSDWSGGTMSTVRQLSLRDVDGQAQLFSEPIPALNEIEGQPETSDPQSVTADQSASLGKATSDAYRLHIDLSQDKNAPSEETLVELNDAHGAKVTVGYNFNEQKLFLNRGEDKIAGSMPDLYREICSEQLPVHDGQLTLDIVVDTTSVEVFAQDGEVSLSSNVFLTPGGHEVTLKSLGGTTDVRESKTTPLAVAETQRQ